MSFKAKKAVYLLLLLCGAVVCLSPYIAVAVTGDASFTQRNAVVFPLVLSGFGIIIAASMFARSQFVCQACGQRLLNYQDGSTGVQSGGFIGAFRLLKTKKCPNCGTILE